MIQYPLTQPLYNTDTHMHTTCANGHTHTHFKSNLPMNVSLVRPASKGSTRYRAASTVARIDPICSATGCVTEVDTIKKSLPGSTYLQDLHRHTRRCENEEQKGYNLHYSNSIRQKGVQHLGKALEDLLQSSSHWLSVCVCVCVHVYLTLKQMHDHMHTQLHTCTDTPTTPTPTHAHPHTQTLTHPHPHPHT